MPFPNQNYNKRDSSLPKGCKDLADAIKHEKASALPAFPDPPITRHVILPDMVSVAYIAEITGASNHTLAGLMEKMRIIADAQRSIDYGDAARILRKFGIAAKKSADAD